jgi:hypothetical protein
MQGTDRGRFSCKTRNGNWWEEMVLEDEKMREFLEKKEKGTLTIQRIRQNLGTVEMAGQERGVKTDDAPSDGLLHYGKMVRVKNCELRCYLACDPGDAENAEEALFSSSGSRQEEASARNVWVLRKLNDGTDEFLPSPTGGAGDDDIVRYGDKFALSTTDAIAPQPFYLSSLPVDWSHFSRVSRKQLVFITQEKSFKGMWRIDSVARDSSFDLEGEPVRLGKPVFIKHCSTGSPLACHEAQILNDYGSEYELVAAREPGKKMIWRFTTR